MTFKWSSDEGTAEIYDALAAAHDRGVTVRLLVDAYGNSMTKKQIETLRGRGIRIELFRPFEIGKLLLYYARAHSRAYLFDGKIGYFGGAALTKHWLADDLQNDFTYTDTMYRVTGEGVESIAAMFGKVWTNYAHMIAPGLYQPAELRGTECNAFSLIHTPQNDIHALTTAFWYSCAAATESITIVTPYFVPGKTLSTILKEKAEAGVSVRIITQGSFEFTAVQYAIRSYYDDLLAAGAEIFEYKKPHLHTKLLIIDDYFTICGSANCDIRSQRLNLELIFGVQSKAFAKRNLSIVDSYEPQLHSITLEDRQSTSIVKKGVERMMRMGSEQF